ncbi:hypothetical protein BOX15_Mlig013714g1, partial [Macrostomum lignano]
IQMKLLISIAFLSSMAHIVCSLSCEQYFNNLEKGILKDLIGLKVKDSSGQFAFGLCSDADSSLAGAGLVQLDKAAGNRVLGRWGQFYATAGRGWVELVYMGGKASAEDLADGNCSSTVGWSAHTMLICDATERSGSFRYIGRVAMGNGSGCYSLFELLHRRLCSLEQPQGGLPASAIALIVLLSLFISYLLIGAAIQRFVFKRRGLESIPNYTVWRRFGDCLADGCDFVCRSGGGGGDSSNGRYQQVGGLSDEDDEHLISG